MGTEPRTRSASGIVDSLGAAALLSFVIAGLLMLTAYVALFDVSAPVEKAIFAAVVLVAVVAAVAAHRLGTPTSRLRHPEKVRREQRHVAMATGALIAVMLVLAYAAAFDLNSWAEWTVFGALVLTTLGLAIAVAGD